MSSDDDIKLSDKVEILSTEDEKLKTIGEILSSDSSRKILKLLFNQSLTANDIAQKTDLSLPLVIHHLKKMQSAEVVKITNVGKNTKSHDMKYYTIDKFAIVVLPSEMSIPAKKSKSLFNSFTRIHRMATLGAVSAAAWFTSQFLQASNNVMINNVDESTEASLTMESPEMALSAPEATRSVPAEEFVELSAPQALGEPTFDVFWSVIVVLCVIITGLSIEILIKQKTKNLKKT